MKIILTKIFNIFHKNRINWFSTIYANFMLLPFKEAIKLPILIFGRCTIYNPCGRICFNQKVKYGLLKIGLSDPLRSFYSKSFIHIAGTLHLGENVILRKGINLAVYKNAVLILEDNVSIGNNSTIACVNEIQIGEATSVGNNTTFMDTDYHYVLNLKTRIVKTDTKKIEIGKYNWIGGNCIIKKGSKTPVGTILAGPFSMIGKDYTETVPEFSIIGGSPAKLIASEFRRINNYKIENELAKYFSNRNNEFFRFDDFIDINDICKPAKTL